MPSGRFKPVTPEEEERIKELYGVAKNIDRVCEGVRRSKWTVRRVLFGHKKTEQPKAGCFNWNDYKNSMI